MEKEKIMKNSIKEIDYLKLGKMNLTDLAVASMGQNFSITPIQMITGLTVLSLISSISGILTVHM